MVSLNRAFQIMWCCVLCLIAVSMAAQSNAQVAGNSVLPQGYIHKISMPLVVQPAGTAQPQYATPIVGPNSYVSGTDLEWAVYTEWLPVGHAFVDPNGIDTMELDVSGTDLNGHSVQNQVVASIDFTSCPSAHHPIWWTVGARIDTTNFQSGSVLTLHASGKPHDTEWIDLAATWTVTVNNALFEFGNQDLLAKDPTAEEDLDGMFQPLENPYGTVPGLQEWEFGTGPTKADIIADLPNYTAFIAKTHGFLSPTYGGIFGDYFLGPLTGWLGSDMITPSDVAGAVAHKSQSQPPYTFAYFDACNVFGDAMDGGFDDYSMADAFLEGSDDGGGDGDFGYPDPFPSAGSGDPDRAALGYHDELVSDGNLASFNGALMNDMAYQNDSLQDGLIAASAQGEPLVRVGGTEALPILAPELPIVEGDQSMTLRGVYPGTVAPNPSCGQGLQAGDSWYFQDMDAEYTGPQ